MISSRGRVYGYGRAVTREYRCYGCRGSRLRRLILGLNEPTFDADRARDLVLRLRPLRNRLAPYQMRHELHASCQFMHPHATHAT